MLTLGGGYSQEDARRYRRCRNREINGVWSGTMGLKRCETGLTLVKIKVCCGCAWGARGHRIERRVKKNWTGRGGGVHAVSPRGERVGGIEKGLISDRETPRSGGPCCPFSFADRSRGFSLGLAGLVVCFEQSQAFPLICI